MDPEVRDVKVERELMGCQILGYRDEGLVGCDGVDGVTLTWKSLRVQ